MFKGLCIPGMSQGNDAGCGERVAGAGAVNGRRGPTLEQRWNARVDYLLSLQNPDGWWKAELRDERDHGCRGSAPARVPGHPRRRPPRGRRNGSARQRTDGSWSIFYGGPGDLSTTVEAYVALRLAGDAPEAEHMRAAAELVREHGGVENARVFTHIWLALFGAGPWDQRPGAPARDDAAAGLVPAEHLRLRLLGAADDRARCRSSSPTGPKRPLPFTIDELDAGTGYWPPQAHDLTGRALLVLDRVLHAYEHRPMHADPRPRARASRALDRRSPGGRRLVGRDPAAVGVLADRPAPPRLCARSPGDGAGLEGLDTFTIDDGGRRLEACQSPVWDTALPLIALADAGVPRR